MLYDKNIVETRFKPLFSTFFSRDVGRWFYVYIICCCCCLTLTLLKNLESVVTEMLEPYYTRLCLLLLLHAAVPALLCEMNIDARLYSGGKLFVL